MPRTSFRLGLLALSCLGCGGRTSLERTIFEQGGSSAAGVPAMGGTPGGAGNAPVGGTSPKPGPEPVTRTRLKVTGLSVGGGHSCALFSGRLKCWGCDCFGATGLEQQSEHGDEPGEMGNALPFVNVGSGLRIASVHAGTDATTCALLEGGAIKCWGDDDFGQLGIGSVIDRGRNPGDMGDALPFVDLGTGVVAVAVAAGGNHTCAILGDRSLKCWGNDSNGQLGLPGWDTRGNFSGQMGDLLPRVDLGGEMVAQVVTGWRHTCVRLASSGVKCWGWKEAAGSEALLPRDSLTNVELGSGVTANLLAAGGLNSCAALSDGTIRCWVSPELDTAGWSPSRALTMPSPVAMLGVGGDRGCALLVDGSVHCWPVPVLAGTKAVAIQMGAGRRAREMAMSGSRSTSHGCALLDDDSVKCWGDNRSGQLGAGDRESRSGDVDNLVTVDLGDEPP